MNLYIRSIFSIALAFCLFLSACTKEEDTVSVEVEVEEPTQGETVTLTGTVLDTAETVISSAALRFQLGDFDTEIITDENGFYEVELPASEEKGIVIAAKAQYNRTIQSIDLNAEDAQKDIYLLQDPTVASVNLELSTDTLFTLRGRLIDQYGTPVPDVFLIGESIYEGDDEVKFSGKTDDDGFFEFIEEQKDYQVHLIFSSQLVFPCFDRLTQIYTDNNTNLLDVGDITFPISNPVEITPDVLITECQSIEYVNHIYLPGDINVLEELLVDNQSYTICDNSVGGAWVYNGVRSADKQSFNGQFQNLDDFANPQSYSLCTPTENFAEVRSANGTSLTLEPNYDASSKTVTVDDGLGEVSFSWQGSFSSSSNGGSYSFSNIIAFEKIDENQNIIYELSNNGKYYVNWVTPGSGVLTVEVELSNGSTEFITVRFRV